MPRNTFISSASHFFEGKFQSPSQSKAILVITSILPAWHPSDKELDLRSRLLFLVCVIYKDTPLSWKLNGFNVPSAVHLFSFGLCVFCGLFWYMSFRRWRRQRGAVLVSFSSERMDALSHSHFNPHTWREVGISGYFFSNFDRSKSFIYHHFIGPSKVGAGL